MYARLLQPDHFRRRSDRAELLCMNWLDESLTHCVVGRMPEHFHGIAKTITWMSIKLPRTHVPHYRKSASLRRRKTNIPDDWSDKQCVFEQWYTLLHPRFHFFRHLCHDPCCPLKPHITANKGPTLAPPAQLSQTSSQTAICDWPIYHNPRERDCLRLFFRFCRVATACR